MTLTEAIRERDAWRAAVARVAEQIERLTHHREDKRMNEGLIKYLNLGAVFYFEGDWRTKPGTYRITQVGSLGRYAEDRHGTVSHWHDNVHVDRQPDNAELTGVYYT